jgi:hypothetical protein
MDVIRVFPRRTEWNRKWARPAAYMSEQESSGTDQLMSYLPIFAEAHA